MDLRDLIDPFCNEALARAAEGDYRRLAERIRCGCAKPEERALAAKIILTAPKPSAGRPRKPESFERNMAVCEFVENWQEANNCKKDEAVREAGERFGLKKTQVYAILKEVDAARYPEPEDRFHSG